jgi:hypothetical protein
VEGVSVDSYYIGQTEVTRNLWRAVMGQTRESTTSGGFGMAGRGNHPINDITWYQVHEFLARLYILTGYEWRLPTEAEWEFAAKGGNAGIGNRFTFAGSNNEADVVTATGGFMGSPVGSARPNNLGLYDMSGSVEEWAWNTWSGSHSGGHNPTGPAGHIHNQKARRGGSGGVNAATSNQRHVAARQIRSIDGADGNLGFRIALSADRTAVPQGMIRARDIQRPSMDDRTIPNSWRDPRWVTGDGYVWTTGTGGFGGFSTNIKLWETGEVTINGSIGGGFGGGGNTVTGQTVGQWYSINNMGLVVVTNAGARGQLSYIFMDDDVMATISDGGIQALPRGRMEKVPDTRDERVQARPTIANMTPPAQLAADSPRNHTQIDLSLLDLPANDFPVALREQDARLLDGATAAERQNQGWFMGTGMGGMHTYRKDVDPERFRFVVYQTVPPVAAGSTGNMLAYGTWYTVSDTFLRVIHPTTGYVTEYLYTVSGDSNPSFSHVSFQGYERGDSRSFTIHPNANVTGHTHEIPIEWSGSMVFANRSDGSSTFRADPIAFANCAGCNNPIPNCSCPTLCSACKRHVSNCGCEVQQPVCEHCGRTQPNCECPEPPVVDGARIVRGGLISVCPHCNVEKIFRITRIVATENDAENDAEKDYVRSAAKRNTSGELLASCEGSKSRE